jgi:uncharacterized Zn-binding protein involved in type VI secretion
MANALPVATVGDMTDLMGGPAGALAPPPGPPSPFNNGPIMPLSTSVGVGGKFLATAGNPVAPHGNFTNPKLHGYNPVCGKAVIATKTIATITVEGKPLAVWTSVCNCGHFIIPGPNAVGASVMAGGI